MTRKGTDFRETEVKEMEGLEDFETLVCHLLGQPTFQIKSYSLPLKDRTKWKDFVRKWLWRMKGREGHTQLPSFLLWVFRGLR